MKFKSPHLFLLALFCISQVWAFVALAAPPPRPDEPWVNEYVKRLRNTHANNIDSVIDEIGLLDKSCFGFFGRCLGTGFTVSNPYHPPTRVYLSINKSRLLAPQIETYRKLGLIDPLNYLTFPGSPDVLDWYLKRHSELGKEVVCAFQFDSTSQKNYNLKTFPNAGAAERAGYKVTHQFHCGPCSTLEDLAVYIDKPDLTRPSKVCALYPSLNKKKACMMDLGLTPACAEMWAYNEQHSLGCLKVIVNPDILDEARILKEVKDAKAWLEERIDYKNQASFQPAFPRDFDLKSPLLESSGLPPLILCDENYSGPGFQYGARSRRASGLYSSIPRDDDEIFDKVNPWDAFGDFPDSLEPMVWSDLRETSAF